MKPLRILVPFVFLFVACSPVVPASPKSPDAVAPSIGMPTSDADGNSTSSEGVKATEGAEGDGAAMSVRSARTIKMTASDWSFSPNMITLKKGEKVSLELSAIVGGHGIGIPDLGVRSMRVTPGETVSVDIPTDKTGTFTFICNVPCGSGHKDMKGTIVVED